MKEFLSSFLSWRFVANVLIGVMVNVVRPAHTIAALAVNLLVGVILVVVLSLCLDAVIARRKAR